MRKISFINMKGGVGKTTLSTNVAHCLATRENCKVLVVDMDPQFNATQCFFSGDKYLSDIPFHYPLFIKIPHHASPSSSKMLDRLYNSSQSMSCTTTYPSQGLPNLEILNEYKKKFMYLHSTGHGKEDPDSYGILEYTFDLFGTRNIHIKRHGNAYKV